jgi:hypothetical protein
MPEYYQGPNNSAQIKAVTLTLPVVATLLVIWRISWRARKNVIVLSDYLLVLGLVSFRFRFCLQLPLIIQCLSLCLAGFNLDRKSISNSTAFDLSNVSIFSMGLWISQSRSAARNTECNNTEDCTYPPLV